jgi:hypothetical protein
MPLKENPVLEEHDQLISTEKVDGVPIRVEKRYTYSREDISPEVVNKPKELVFVIEDDEEIEEEIIIQDLSEEIRKLDHEEIHVIDEIKEKHDQIELQVIEKPDEPEPINDKKEKTEVKEEIETNLDKLATQKDPLINEQKVNTNNVDAEKNANIEKSPNKNVTPINPFISKKSVQRVDRKVELKDKKIQLNLEEIEKQYVSGEKTSYEGYLDPKNTNQMQVIQEDLNKLHPRIIKEDKLQKYPYFVNTGWFCCGKKRAQTMLEPLGLGISCYFKLLKAYLICFLVISILNIPLIYIYSSNHPEDLVENYRDALFKTTIGNIASST